MLLVLCLLPAMALGLYLGHHITLRLSRQRIHAGALRRAAADRQQPGASAHGLRPSRQPQTTDRMEIDALW
jgi:hypothetical protein